MAASVINGHNDSLGSDTCDYIANGLAPSFCSSAVHKPKWPDFWATLDIGLVDRLDLEQPFIPSLSYFAFIRLP